MADHRHENPSPSHEIAAYCSCGPVVLRAFQDRRQDEEPYGSYLGDMREPVRLVAALRGVNDVGYDETGVVLTIGERDYKALMDWLRRSVSELERYHRSFTPQNVEEPS